MKLDRGDGCTTFQERSMPRNPTRSSGPRRRPLSTIVQSPSDDGGCGTLSERPGTTQPAQQDRLPKPHQCNALPAFLLTPSPAHCWAPTSPEPSVSPAETLVVSRTHYRNRRDGPWMWGAWEGHGKTRLGPYTRAGGRAWWPLVLFMSLESILSLHQSVSSVTQSSDSVTP